MPDNEIESRHVVTVTVADRVNLRLLAQRGLDLFTATARETAEGGAIEGRLSEPEIAALREDGYDVFVHPPVETPPLEIVSDVDDGPSSLEARAAAVPAGYQQSYHILSSVHDYGTSLPGVGSVVVLPERSVQGTKIRALRLRGGTRVDRPGVLILGGVHARELINPDILDNWMFRMAYAIATRSPVSYKSSFYDFSTIELLVNSLDIFVVPLVNPDGRDYVMAAEHQRWWRKNRAAQPVDLNRNYDFLFHSGIGTSTDPGSDVYRGPYPFSEPETRNIRWLLDAFPHISAVLDLHSFSELILYPWGDDNNQTTDPGQNFRVPHPDRGIPNDDRYREYIPNADLNWFVRASNRMRDVIAKPRGRAYTVQQAVGLYPTSATVDDYAYSRQFVNPALRNIKAVTIETGRAPEPGGDVLAAFQPPFDEVMRMRDEVGPAVLEFLLEVMCPSGSDAQLLRSAQGVLERHLAGSGETRDLYDGLVAQGPRILQALGENPRARVQAATALKRLVALAEDEQDPLLDHDLVEKLGQAAAVVAEAVPESRDLLDAFAKLSAQASGNRLSSLLAPGQPAD